MKDKVSYWTLRRHAQCTVHSWSRSTGASDDEHDEVHEPLIEPDLRADDRYEAAEVEQPLPDVHPSHSHHYAKTLRHRSSKEYEYDCDEFDVHEYSDSEDDVTNCDQSEALRNQIADWAISEKVKDNTVDKLLKVLKPYHPELPITCRTLTSVSRQPANIMKIAGGDYAHFGILNGLKCFEKDIIALGVNVINYQISIDGLPLFKSCGVQLWPILGRVVGAKFPFVIGAFCGQTKPSSAEEFLCCFVREAISLKHSGFTLQGISFTAQPACYVCDAPARALIKQTKAHTGYFGCDRCVEKGEYVQGRVTFPQLTAEKRTDDLFARVAYANHQLSRSPLIEVGCGLVSGCVLDYMDLVCLGIVRRLLHFWLRGELRIRLSARHVTIISQKLISMRSNIPCEFARKPRGLTDLEYWKASELRQFLLYTGPVVLKDMKMGKKLYDHFVCLSVIMHILLSSSLSAHYSQYVEELAVTWVRMGAKLYGKHFVVYNVHSLIHLVDDCRKFGSLNNISAFPYENFMRIIKRVIRKPQFILQQLSNRMAEGFFNPNSDALSTCGVKYEHTSGPMLVGVLHCKQYRQVQLTDSLIKMTSPDNCIMYRNHIGLVTNVVSDGSTTSVIVQRFTSLRAFFTKPLKSSDIGIYKVGKLNGHMEICRVSDIERKYVLLPYRDDRKWIAIPLNHCL